MASAATGAAAGEYATRRYKEGLRRWRSRTRLILAILCGPFIAGGFAILFIDGNRLSWAAGMLCGAATTFRRINLRALWTTRQCKSPK